MSAGNVDESMAELNAGDELDEEKLVTAAYAELHRIASSLMRNCRPGHTLQPTALVNEAWMKLNGTHGWNNKAHFFGAAARAMRQVLIAYARQKSATKRAGLAARITFAELAVQSEEPDLDVLQVDLALDALGEADASLARLIELRYFAGCTLQEISDLSGRSLASIKRDWTYARAWLYEYMSKGTGA
jgi:RNA polymerase sigma factor (TIGR02999 family)